MLELAVGTARVVLDELHGGRVERLEVGGFALLVPPEIDDQNYGAFPMAPWAGRLRDGRFTFDGVEHQLPLNKPPHAIHGTVRDQHWTVVKSTPRSATLSVALADPWPFSGSVVQRFELDEHSLALTMEVHAAGHAMPASCGWHPWWNRNGVRGDPIELELHADGMYKRDDDGIPDGELGPVTAPPWDDCFTDLGDPVAVVRWPHAASVAISSDCSCVVVYTESEHAVCVEPQTDPPDALNLRPATIPPEGVLTAHTTWGWEIEP